MRHVGVTEQQPVSAPSVRCMLFRLLDVLEMWEQRAYLSRSEPGGGVQVDQTSAVRLVHRLSVRLVGADGVRDQRSHS
ncbi:hypothetical protein BJF84_15445 [Rhodococcus sp. CUA-806]|nr:hypothetical protein BJF84_25880 [Rhodococcus sp. CUA-806]OLT34957.1 hypothetical protein BJF84_15445 [Rhodococcus sp. CUA-806]